MIVKNKESDQLKLQQLVHRHGITDVLLMLADIWRFTHRTRSALIYRTLIEAREKIIGAERGNRETPAVQVSNGDPPASTDGVAP